FVDAAEPFRLFNGEPAEVGTVSIGHVGKASADKVVIGPEQRVTTLQVDVVAQHHQGTASVFGVDASSGIGQHDGGNAHTREDTHRKRHLPRRVAFVQMHSTLHDRHWSLLQLANDKPARVADGGAAGKVWNLSVRDAGGVSQFFSKATES